MINDSKAILETAARCAEIKKGVNNLANLIAEFLSIQVERHHHEAPVSSSGPRFLGRSSN